MPQIDFTVFFIFALWIFPIFFSVFYYALVYLYPVFVLWNGVILYLTNLAVLKLFFFKEFKFLFSYDYLVFLN